LRSPEIKSTHSTQPLQPKSEEPLPFFNKKGATNVLTNSNKSSFFFNSNISNSENPSPIFNKLPVQAKLTIGEPGDKYENEADHIGDQVIQPMAKAGSLPPSPHPNLQFKPVFESSIDEGEEIPVQKKCEACNEDEKIKKMELDENETSVQAKLEPEPKQSSLESTLNATKGGGNQLEQPIRAHMEKVIGADFTGVRIHTDSNAVQMNKELGAQAFTHGNDIYFNAGRFNPGNTESKKLLGHELTHTIQQGKSPTGIQKEDGESKLDRLNEMLNRWNVPEEEVIQLCGQLDQSEKREVLAGGYRNRMASALNIREMVRAVNHLGPPLSVKLEWVDQAALFTFMISYQDIREMVRQSSVEERNELKKETWKTFFVAVCNNQTMVTALDDLGYDLVTKLTWLQAEVFDARTELDYASVKPWIVHSNTTLEERESLKTEEWKNFFVAICTNQTMVEALDDLQYDLITKLTWLQAEVFSVRVELDYATIKPWIIHPNTTQEERESLKTEEWKNFFVAVCTNQTMVEALDDLQYDLITKLTWLEAELIVTSWELDYSAIQPWIVHPNTTQAERDALKTEEWRNFFFAICDNTTIITAVEDLQFDLQTKIEWVRSLAGLEEVKQVIDNASAVEREAVWQDAAYLSQLRSEVDVNFYLWIIVKIRMKFVGTVAHSDAVDADRAIRTHLAAYVGGAVADSRQIEGIVAVVDDTHWNIAGEHRYGATVWATKNINGFVDLEGRVWIHQDKGNPGTMVHEAVHKYSTDALIQISQPLNEGVTEYFTRIVCNAEGINIAGRTNYQSNRNTVQKLINMSGISEVLVARAFFDGETDALKTAFILSKIISPTTPVGWPERLSRATSDWNQFIQATKDKDWATADGFL
jgi:ribosomal protein S11